MIDIFETYKLHEENSADVVEWCNMIYDSCFAEFFDSERQLYDLLKNTARPISDAELENILTTLPLQLFSASEALSQLKIKSELVKFEIKDKLYNTEHSSTASSATGRKEEAAYSVIADQVLQAAYISVIDRVEKEISYSKELIMTAKKIWDARRNTEQASPINPVLPDYQVPTQSYIKGQENTIR